MTMENKDLGLLTWNDTLEIADRIRKHWEKTRGPKEEYYLTLGKEVLAKTISWYSILRELNYHPYEIEKILARTIEISKNIEDALPIVLEEWCDEEEDAWTDFPDSRNFVIEVRYLLKTWGYKKLRPRKVKKRYPIVKIQALRREGKTLRQISKELGIPKSTVFDILSKD